MESKHVGTDWSCIYGHQELLGWKRCPQQGLGQPQRPGQERWHLLSLLLGLSHVLRHGMLLSSQLGAEILCFLIRQRSPQAVPCGAEQFSQLVPRCSRAGLSSAGLPPPGAVAGPGRSACPSGTAQCFPSDPFNLLFASRNSLCSSCCAVSLAETNRSPRCLQGRRSCLGKSLHPSPSWGTAL